MSRTVIVPNFFYVAFAAVPLDFLGEPYVKKLSDLLLRIKFPTGIFFVF